MRSEDTPLEDPPFMALKSVGVVPFTMDEVVILTLELVIRDVDVFTLDSRPLLYFSSLLDLSSSRTNKCCSCSGRRARFSSSLSLPVDRPLADERGVVLLDMMGTNHSDSLLYFGFLV